MIILSESIHFLFKNGDDVFLMCWTRNQTQIGPHFDNIGDADDWRQSHDVYRDEKFIVSPEIEEHISKKLFFVED